MKKFEVEVTWIMSATISVEAETADHAEELVSAGDLPVGHFCKGSFEILDTTETE